MGTASFIHTRAFTMAKRTLQSYTPGAFIMGGIHSGNSTLDLAIAICVDFTTDFHARGFIQASIIIGFNHASVSMGFAPDSVTAAFTRVFSTEVSPVGFITDFTVNRLIS